MTILHLLGKLANFYSMNYLKHMVAPFGHVSGTVLVLRLVAHPPGMAMGQGPRLKSIWVRVVFGYFYHLLMRFYE